jgi:hypothetical protein
LDQESRTVAANQHGRSGTLLIGVGILWLLLAGALLIYQLVTPGRVEIAWETATEQRTAGFNIYRSSEPTQGFSLINRDHIISSQGGSVSGARYSFFDDDVEAGKTYYYLLEEVEFDGTQNRYKDEIFEHTVPGITWWAVILTAGSAAAGAALILSGLREKKET